MSTPTLEELTDTNKETYSKIRFKNKALTGEYILVGGAVTTKELYASFKMNPAHLCEDGKVRAFGSVIASVDDIEYLGEEEL